MIIFAPNHDPQTRANHSVALNLITGSSMAVVDADATRDNLISALEAANIPLLAMSHGREAYLIDQNKGIAICDGDVGLLSDRATFAFACLTANELGETVAVKGGSWWGYTGRISAPSEAPECLPFFVDIFRFIRDFFPSHSSQHRCQHFLEHLKVLCEAARVRLNDIFLDGTDVDSDAFLCLLHIWDRLRVWLPGATEPIHHPDCNLPVFLL